LAVSKTLNELASLYGVMQGICSEFNFNEKFNLNKMSGYYGNIRTIAEEWAIQFD
jgi:hypothetical protein